MIRKTCAEILMEIKKTNPEYPIIIQQKRTDKEIAIIAGEKKGWDVYVYRSNGFIFTKIAKELSNEIIVKLQNQIKKW